MNFEFFPVEIQDLILGHLFPPYSLKVLRFLEKNHLPNPSSQLRLEYIKSCPGDSAKIAHPHQYILNHELYPLVQRAHLRAFNGTLSLEAKDNCKITVFDRNSLRQQRLKAWLLQRYGPSISRVSTTNLDITDCGLVSFCSQLENLQQFHIEKRRSGNSLLPLSSSSYRAITQGLVKLSVASVARGELNGEIAQIFNKHMATMREDALKAVSGRMEVSRSCTINVPVRWFYNATKLGEEEFVLRIELDLDDDGSQVRKIGLIGMVDRVPFSTDLNPAPLTWATYGPRVIMW